MIASLLAEFSLYSWEVWEFVGLCMNGGRVLPCAASVLGSPPSSSGTISLIISRLDSEGVAGSPIRTLFFFLGGGVVKAVENSFVQAESYFDSALAVNSDRAKPIVM